VDSRGTAYADELRANCTWERSRIAVSRSDLWHIKRLLTDVSSKPLQERYVFPASDLQAISTQFLLNGQAYDVLEYGGTYAGLPREFRELEEFVAELRRRTQQ
jgi:hypothetical protein